MKRRSQKTWTFRVVESTSSCPSNDFDLEKWMAEILYRYWKRTVRDKDHSHQVVGDCQKNDSK